MENSNVVRNETQALLSTIDNPYNPFKEFDEWFAYDLFHGYNSCGLMSRYMDTVFSKEMLINETDCQIMAVDEIVKNDPTGIYIKVEEIVPIFSVS